MLKKLLYFTGSLILSLMLISTQIMASELYYEIPVGEPETMFGKSNLDPNHNMIDDDNSPFIWRGDSDKGLVVKGKPGVEWSQIEFIPEVNSGTIDTTEGLWFHYKFKINNPNEKSIFAIKMRVYDGRTEGDWPEINLAGIIQDPNIETGIHMWSEMTAKSGTYEGKINLLPYFEKSYTKEGNTFEAFDLPDAEFKFTNLHIAMDATAGAELEISYLIFDDEKASNTIGVGTTKPTVTPPETPGNTATDASTATPTVSPTKAPSPSATTAQPDSTDNDTENNNNGISPVIIGVIVVVVIAAIGVAVYFILKKKKSK